MSVSLNFFLYKMRMLIQQFYRVIWGFKWELYKVYISKILTTAYITKLIVILGSTYETLDTSRHCPSGLHTRTVQSHNMKKKRHIYWRRYKIQDALYKEPWCLSPPENRHLETTHNSPNLHQLPCHIFLNPFPFKNDSSFVKIQKPQLAKSQL